MSAGLVESRAATPRLDEIDWLKGFAILCVLMIHAQPLLGTWWHEYIVNQAVSLFLVLFGITSEIWWSSRKLDESGGPILRRWLTSRLWRLMLPVWGGLALWWCVALVLGSSVPLSPEVLLTPSAVLASALGYTPTIGTSWFVTLIIECVILFPALRWCVVRLGRTACLVLSGLVAYASHWYCLTVMELGVRWLPPGGSDFFHFWTFAPQYLVLVVAGIAIARTPGMSSTAVGVGSLVLFAAGAVLHAHVLTNVFWTCSLGGFQRLMDVPLTIALLFLFRQLSPWRSGLRWLAWCGLASWGLYVGQMLSHDLVQRMGFRPEEDPSSLARWLYFFGLLATALVSVWVGEWLRTAARTALGSRGAETSGSS